MAWRRSRTSPPHDGPILHAAAVPLACPDITSECRAFWDGSGRGAVLRRLGYVAMSLSIDASTSRTCRLRNATPERLAKLIEANLADLLRVVEFNVDRG